MGAIAVDAVRTTAFGLDVYSETPLSLIPVRAVDPTGRSLLLSVESGAESKPLWADSAELICDERQPDGSENFSIRRHETLGYLISGPEYGSSLLSADGALLRCFPENRQDRAWQRLLIAQVLPFATLLQGLEVLHASAVERDGSALALLGPSRAGKTSLALELCHRGWTFLADDVVALEVQERRLLAHPGTGIAGVDVLRRGPLPYGWVSTDALISHDSREQLVRIEGRACPSPLESLVFIDRRADGPKVPRFAPVTEALTLLAATFNFVLTTPQRLLGLLDVAACASRLRVTRIEARSDMPGSELAAVVGTWLDSS
jgi:hypothetical protein